MEPEIKCNTLLIKKYRDALITWDEDVLRQFDNDKIELDTSYDTVCPCGHCVAIEKVTIASRISGNHFSISQIDKLFEWKIMSSSSNYDIWILYKAIGRQGSYISDPGSKLCTGSSEIIHWMKKFDKDLIGQWRHSKYGTSIGHAWYYSSIHTHIHCSRVLNYLIEECGLDPNCESLVDIDGDDIFTVAPRINGIHYHGSSILTLAINDMDVASVQYLFESGCSSDLIKYHYDLLSDSEYGYKGRDSLMRLVYKYTFTYETELHKKYIKDHDRCNKFIAINLGIDGPIIEFEDCTKCQTKKYQKIVPDADSIIYDIWTTINICILEGGYDVGYMDMNGKTLEDHLLDVKTKPNHGPDSETKIIDFYRNR
jgi:hypothetical protein